MNLSQMYHLHEQNIFDIRNLSNKICSCKRGLKKAFDCVDHSTLLRKLYHYGIREKSFEWSQSYVSDTVQICKVNQTLSNKRIVKCGVPQGSNLGPLLFLLYINDLPNCLSSSAASMFVDDTNISTYGTSAVENQEHLNHD
jgi:hypothetical protein